MPNAKNVDRPALVVGPGRTASSYLLDRLQFGRDDFQNIIENEIYRDLHRDLTQRWWCIDNWKYVCTEQEVDRRVIEAIRQTYVVLFPSERPHWVMKAIWEQHDPDLLHALFPGARYVHLVRDPRTNIASMMERIGWSFQRGCEMYAKSNETALRFERFADRYLRVRQEDFVDRRDETWRRLLEFLGVPPKESNWDRELNVSPSQQGKVDRKRADSALEWKKLPDHVIRMAERLGYAKSA
jgi:hypothetical protein